ncbi:carbohydrate kinase family protein [Anoxybacterium hadale]|uniref:Carbohydrate kinase family protein n=1 Tax=Anoxybacterium hadale TaxID=3408580 RepID=A0ACD1AF70_9FIRM|nr:carbohydrate kinase family protein [Clostridiales bacterium]
MRPLVSMHGFLCRKEGLEMKKDVLAIGELNADLILQGLATVPLLGREILCKNSDLQLGSSTAICACVMASLGLKTGFVGHLGTDTWGKVCETYLHRYGVDTAHVLQEESLQTGLTVSLSCGHDRALVTHQGDTIDCLTADKLPPQPWLEARHIHIGAFFLQTKLAAGLPAFLEKAKAHGMTLSLDAGWQESQTWDNGLSQVLPYIDVFFPNESETCGIGGSDDVRQAALRVHSMMKNGTLVVKRGPQGALAIRGDETIEQGAYKTKVIDTTGAGDSFNAGFLYAYLNNMDLARCLNYGNAAGAVSVTKMGGTSQCPTLHEVENCIRHGETFGS